jgi:hypothetical protein
MKVSQKQFKKYCALRDAAHFTEERMKAAETLAEKLELDKQRKSLLEKALAALA